MHNPFDRKTVSVTPPAAIINNASLTTAAVDTRGFRYAVFKIYLGATDIALTALKVQESDDAGMSGAADISGTVFGTSVNDTGAASTLPSATDDNKLFEIFIDLKSGNRKRYLDLVATVGNGSTGAFVTAWCELYRASEAPRLASQSGVGQRLVA